MIPSTIFRWLPVAGFSTAALSGALGYYVVGYENQIHKFWSEFQRASADSHGLLASRMHELKTKLMENSGLHKQDPGVLRSVLRLEISRGYLDQLEIYRKSDCRLIAKSRVNSIPIKGGCPASENNSFTWDRPVASNTNISRLSGALHTSQGSGFWLAGYLRFDNTWAELRPFLKKHLNNLSLEFESQTYPGITMPSPATNPAIMVWSKNALINWIGSNGGGVSGLFFIFSIWSFIAALTTYAFLVRHFIRQEESQKKIRINFFIWVKNLLQNSATQTLATVQYSGHEWEDFLAKTHCSELLKIYEKEMAEVKSFSARYQKMNKKMDSLQEENAWLKNQLGYITECTVLKDQILSTSEFLHHKTQKNLELIDRLRNHYKTSAGVSFKQFVKLTEFWNRGIKELGARKFFRSLCETPVKNSNIHRFDQSVQQFIFLSKKLGNFSDGMEENLCQIKKYTKNLSLILSHWSALAMTETQKENKIDSMQQFLTETAPILRAQILQKSWSFEWDPVIEKWPLPPTPEVILQASCLIIIKMILGQGLLQKEIFISGKLGKNSYYLLIHSSGPQNTKQSQADLNLKELSKARNLLSPWSVDCSYLPSGPSYGSFMISWKFTSHSRSYKNTENHQIT